MNTETHTTTDTPTEAPGGAPVPADAAKAAKTAGTSPKALFAQLSAFLGPMADAAGLTLRPFSLTTFTSMQLAGIQVGSAGFATINEAQRLQQLQALLVLQTAPLGSLKRALRLANGDFDKFFWDYCFEQGQSLPLEAMVELSEQLESEMPAVEAASQIDVEVPPDMQSREKTPGN